MFLPMPSAHRSSSFKRGEVSHSALVPPAAAVDSQRTDTRELIAIVAAHIKR